MRPPAAMPIILAVAAAAILSGCVTTTNDAPESTTSDATFRNNPEFGMNWEKIELPAQVTPGTDATWLMRAINSAPDGENEFSYKDGCGNPWNIRLHGPDGNTVDYEGDVMQCQAFAEKTFVGGDTKDFQWTWDGREWTDGAWRDAPSGTYTLTVGFVALHAGVHPSEAEAVTTFDVA